MQLIKVILRLGISHRIDKYNFNEEKNERKGCQLFFLKGAEDKLMGKKNIINRSASW